MVDGAKILKPSTLIKLINDEVGDVRHPGKNGILESIEDKSMNIESSYEKFQRSIMDQKKHYPDPVPVININYNETSIPFLTLKSFSLWQGKQKSKKTTALALAVSSFISNNKVTSGIQFSSGLDGVVLFFDNEQGESYAARTMKLILRLAGLETSPKLIYCDLREFSPSERLEVIKAGIQNTPEVKLVVIDGLVDLLTDFMDATEGHLTTTEILKLCSLYNIHIAGVLHQNKNDKNARAHIGTISSQKCEVEISTEVDPNDRNQSFVICVNSRGISFEQFAIRWDKGLLPCINQETELINISDLKANKKFKQSKELMESIFSPLSELTNTAVINAVRNATSRSESTAKRYLDDWIIWQLVLKGIDGKYRMNNKEGSKVHEGSKRVHEPDS